MIGLDGRLVALDADAFARALPHRLLALPFPAAPAAIGDTWADPGLLRPFRDLLPAALPTSGAATATVDTLEPGGLATLTSRGELAAEGLLVQIDGETTWDAVAGRLVHRTLSARLAAPGGPDPGTLFAEAHLVLE